ncbi:MAG: hypothetical protein EXR69_16720, partial [Myxococcales bacterium]|nr:hypothetical protein [Myxococcales bacterium]
MAEPRKLFGRPSTLLLDEHPGQPRPPPVLLEPAPWRSMVPRSPPPAPTNPEPLVGGRVPSVASLPSELEDYEDLDDTGVHAGETPAQEADDAVWGAAFEVDDSRVARRGGVAAEPFVAAQSPESADSDSGVATPEGGQDSEVTGVGEQVALPEGFDFDFALQAEPPAQAEPP